MSDTALTKRDAMSTMLGFKTVSLTEIDEETKKVLKDTVAKDTTDSELAYFLNVALAQELNPFNKEVWCIKYDGKLTIQTGRDGFLKLAKRDPSFDAIRSCEVRESDAFTMDPISGDIEHRIVGKRGAILGAYAVITRKDGSRLSKYVSISEYRGSSPIWKKYESAMICKCAEAVLCRQFAGVTGISAEEAMPDEGISSNGSPVVHAEVVSVKDDLIRGIAKCKNLEEFDKYKQHVAATAGKLFEKEREEVYEAARNKLRELNGGVVDAEIVTPEKSQAEADTLTEEELDNFTVAIREAEDVDALTGLWNDAIAPLPMTPEQRGKLTAIYDAAMEKLKPSTPAK